MYQAIGSLMATPCRLYLSWLHNRRESVYSDTDNGCLDKCEKQKREQHRSGGAGVRDHVRHVHRFVTGCLRTSVASCAHYQ